MGFGGLVSPLLFKETEAVKELVHIVASLTGHHSYPCSCALAILQTIFPLTQAVISLASTLWSILVCEVEDVHMLKSSSSPASSGFRWTKAGREKGHDLFKSMTVHSHLSLLHFLNYFMKCLTFGKLKTPGTTFLLQCTQNTLHPFCPWAWCVTSHSLLSMAPQASQSTLNYFVFPCSPLSLMFSITDVSSALFHLSLFLSSGFKHRRLDLWSSYGTRKLPGCHNRQYCKIRYKRELV